MHTNWLQEALEGGKVALGPFCKSTEGSTYEVAGLAGFTYCIIDMEHGPMSFETAQTLVRVCELRRMSPVIRIPTNEPWMVQKALDIGAHGVQVVCLCGCVAVCLYVCVAIVHNQPHKQKKSDTKIRSSSALRPARLGSSAMN
eukprot:NODE_4637_length_781_cov_21.863388_g3856_i0.p1 GENE.NODE_4637_length_781_cov_21.863388_g3856_i0~~NODE_4637_length_781_cov_21.863388_g3856_i0.p1  ORF type:complete len:143 (-),score=26.27 NODE_4637_length_781_cov_21.863388_g3856_i0:205-633(-)